MAYTRTPYCYQPNYASSAYSGPSTSLRPSFETNGESNPPSHCDTNEYFSRSQSRSTNISSVSLPNLTVEDTTSPTRPANLERLIRDHLKTDEGRRDLQAWLDEGQEVASEFTPELPKNVNDYIQSFITKATAVIQNGCKKSKDGIRNLGILRNRSMVNLNDHNLTNDTRKQDAIYFLARIDKKLYDVAKSAKKAAVRSGNMIMGKENKTKSERWQDELNKSYRAMMHKESPAK
ncbi:uncharacterized protein H6S33_003822 [Morchella sextelata]|uniref:uncharacterized protein n=1 Tax=Morchella sextelata TaxID=1174677 RepID=UPI001D039847|nr:uncharacterized protein H6S33_003822 [Morchella sextelata]KAH0606161.1 hypothetical protein H6S33_003822 [Morchella sextelata]